MVNCSHLLLEIIYQDAQHLISTHQFTGGYPPFYIFNTRHQSSYAESVARHVSASSIINMNTPTLVIMHKLNSLDQVIWKEGYTEEYFGLNDFPAWATITETEYNKIKDIVGHAFPTIEISTVKDDENRSPKRVKWHIVALDNLDPHEWSNNNYFAPVISMVELSLIVSLTIHH